MSAAETRQYIEHRLRVANPLREVVFTESACALIHQIAGGIPRTINIVCDASLLVAYVAETTAVTPALVREAARTIDAQQVSLRLRRPRHLRFWQRLWASAAALVAILVLMLTFDTAVSRRAPFGWRAHVPVDSSTATDASRPPTPEAALASARAPVALVHLASYHTGEQAEEFASRLTLSPGQVVYLQTVAAAGQAWHRVLVGNFADLPAAAAFASAAKQAGTFDYAQPVQVPADDLREWRPRH
jgi:general secretion pathway protein A